MVNLSEMYSISFVARFALNQRLQRTFKLEMRITLNNKLIIYCICILLSLLVALPGRILWIFFFPFCTKAQLWNISESNNCDFLMNHKRGENEHK